MGVFAQFLFKTTDETPPLLTL